MYDTILNARPMLLLYFFCLFKTSKLDKSKGHPITGKEGPEEEQRYISTLPSTSALDGGR